MTSVRIGIFAPSSTGDDRRPSGSIEWRPTRRRTVSGDVVLPAPFTVGLLATAPVIEVAPTGADWVWRVVERVQGGAPDYRYLAVPNVGTVVDYADLVEVDPETLTPTAAPEAAWWSIVKDLTDRIAYLEAHGGGGTGTPTGVLTDTDGTPYFTVSAGGPIQLDADSVPYVATPGGGIGLDTDGTPYLTV